MAARLQEAGTFTPDLLHCGLAYHVQEKERGCLPREIQLALIEIDKCLIKVAPGVIASIRVNPARGWRATGEGSATTCS